jgi:hypothetical protein
MTLPERFAGARDWADGSAMGDTDDASGSAE